MADAKVVDPLEYDDIGGARRGQDVAVEARQRALAGAVAQHAIAADAFIDHGPAAVCGQAFGQPVGPARVLVGGRDRAVGNGVAEHHDRPRSGRLHLDAGEEGPGEEGRLHREGHSAGEVAGARDVAGLGAGGVAGAGTRVGRQVEADR